MPKIAPTMLTNANAVLHCISAVCSSTKQHYAASNVFTEGIDESRATEAHMMAVTVISSATSSLRLQQPRMKSNAHTAQGSGQLLNV